MLKRSIFFIFIFVLAAGVVGYAVMSFGDNQAKEEAGKEDSSKKASVDEIDEEEPVEEITEEESEEPSSISSKGSGPFVVIQTPKGNMVIEMYPDVAPKNVANYIKLINDGFYNGLLFFRYEPGFVIQGGSANNKNTGSAGTVDSEYSSKKHVTGTVAMAATQPGGPKNSNSQFYICLAPAPFLDNDYTIIGQVVEGLDVLKKIEINEPMTKVYVRQ